MAIWQFVLDLVPVSAAKVAGMPAARMSSDQLDEMHLDFSETDTEKLISHLSSILPEKTSWSPAIRIWGDEETDDIQVGLNGETIEDVRFRLNVADLKLPLIGGICILARQFDCCFATPDGAIVQPNREAVVRLLLQSRAMKFLRDPQRFLADAIRLDKTDS